MASHLLVTVGSTNFDDLILFLARNIDKVVTKLDLTSITVQTGPTSSKNNSEWLEIFRKSSATQLEIEINGYFTEFNMQLEKADFIISTASAGVILDGIDL